MRLFFKSIFVIDFCFVKRTRGSGKEKGKMEDNQVGEKKVISE